MNNFHMREGKVEFRWKRWRNKKRQEVSSCLMVLFSGMVLLGGGGVALAGPTGGQITGGTGSINQTGPTTNVNQTSSVLNINWQDFSIGVNETVNFNQPDANAIAINRVIGGVPSQLAGALNANGRVFILNSAGITFTGTSHVNVGALLATTAMTVNGDPTKAASYSGSGYGSVVNQGEITISNGGFAILAAPYVQNTGFIKADLGTIALAGTNSFTLDLSGTGLINFVVPAGAVEKIVSGGKAVGVDNSGTLQARSGQVIISASVASEVMNAVVNLNGIVDADAFAPNGKGGSVLVTAADNINIDGQVTARGAGTGAGGQIVTKAGEDDAIGALAFVSAAGGATGKGGLIEVSGKQVGLGGNIDAGSGGSLLIDPTNITIVSGGTGSIAGSQIGEFFLQNQLRHNVSVSLVANQNVEFQALTTDHRMVGGNGNLSITAGATTIGNIVIDGTNDAIVQGAGFIHMTANGGNIGASGHAFNLTTGVGQSVAAQGVTQAGDIVLNAGNDIYVKNVTVLSSGAGNLHALFSANAGHSFHAGGQIDVEALASGVGLQVADAEIHINAANHIDLHGITDRASANQPGGGEGASARAIVTLNGSQVADAGDLTVAANVAGSSGFDFNAIADLEISNASDVHIAGDAVDVSAKANVFSASNALANAHAGFVNAGAIVLDSVNVNAGVQADKVGFIVAKASFNADGSDISIARDVVVEASANNANLGRSASASANLFLTASQSDVSVQGNVSVTALALNGGGSKDADAFARLDIAAQGAVEVGGDVTVTANAQTLHLASGDSSTPNASAIANFSGFSGGVHLHRNLDVEAVASSLNTDSVTANARANFNTFFGNIEIDGSTKVVADARTNAHTFFSTARGAQASASLLIHSEGHVELGAITVTADAEDLGNFQARAVAKASILSNTGSIDILGDVDVEANAQDPAGNSAYANAQFFANGHFGVQIGFAGSIESPAIVGDVTVKAIADNGGSGNASALAGLTLNTKVGPVGVIGNVAVNASAHDSGGGNAVANAIADIAAGSGQGSGSIQIGAFSSGEGLPGGNVAVTANAFDGGGGAALTLAELTLDPGTIHVFGDLVVSAQASGFGVPPGGVAASANAQLVFSGASKIEVDGDMSIMANAINNGHGQVNAQGGVAFGSASSIQLAGVTIDVKALNLGAGSGGAKANASFIATNSSVTVQLDALNLQAQASSHGGGNATANAVGKITEQTLSISGDVTVNAVAFRSGGTGNAIALADLELVAGSLGLFVGGNVQVTAHATDHGAGYAQANADGLFVSSSSVHVAGGLLVSADASNTGGKPGNPAASANAELVFGGSGRVQVDGAMSIVAHGTNFGPGQVKVEGDIDFGATTSIDLAGVTVDVKARNLGNGSGGAKANASFGATSNLTLHLDSLNLQAQASSHGGGNATAHANGNITQGSISIIGDVTVNAVAISQGEAGNALARANLLLHASSGSITVGGHVDVNASAEDLHPGPGNAQANAIANLDASSSDIPTVIQIGSGHVTANALSDGPGAAKALAEFTFDPASIHVSGDLDVTANALGTMGNAGTIAASANAQLIFADAGRIEVDGAMLVQAHGTNLGQGQVTAKGSVDFGTAASIDLADVTIDVKALNLGNGSGGAKARASFDATAGISLHIDSLNLQAQASSHGGGGASAQAIGHITQGSLSIPGAVTVNAAAFNAGASGSARALADLRLIASTGNLFVGGNVQVNADAHATDPLAAIATAEAVLGARGILHVAGNVGVIASASTNATTGVTSSVKANALLVAQGSSGASFGGDIIVTANEFSNRASRGAAIAIASLQAGSTDGGPAADLNVAGNVAVEAGAGGGSSEANVFALASLNAFAASNERFDGGIVVRANADDHGSGAAFADAFASLDANSGSVFVNGNIEVEATLQGNGLAFGTMALPSLDRFANVGFASANLFVTAGDGAASLNGVTVTANALLTNPGRARFASTSEGGGSTSGGARAGLQITANFGDIAIQGPVTVDAKAQASASNLFLRAAASGSVHAGEGNVSLIGPLSFRANAQALGSEDAVAGAVSNIQLVAGGDITLPGAASRAIAKAPVSDSGDASAFANLGIIAGHDINITNSGAFAGASANAPFANLGQPVTASANIQILADHNVAIRGNVIAAAVALGGGTGNVADAIVNIQADPASQGSGNVNIFGDIAAFAFADPQNDSALASITVHARNNIFVVGADPIASAHAGAAAAFLQTHFTDSFTGTDGTGGTAIGRITITAGGTITFIDPRESEDQRLALLALPTHTPTLNPNVLTEIQLSIDGQDCGVLGSAGADEGKAAACTKSAINIEAPDALP